MSKEPPRKTIRLGVTVHFEAEADPACFPEAPSGDPVDVARALEDHNRSRPELALPCAIEAAHEGGRPITVSVRRPLFGPCGERIDDRVEDTPHHMERLIQWLKRHGLDAFALAEIIGAGKTVAHATWARYRADKKKPKIQKHDRCKRCRAVLINFPKCDRYCRFCGKPTGNED